MAAGDGVGAAITCLSILWPMPPHSMRRSSLSDTLMIPARPAPATSGSVHQAQVHAQVLRFYLHLPDADVIEDPDAGQLHFQDILGGGRLLQEYS